MIGPNVRVQFVLCLVVAIVYDGVGDEDSPLETHIMSVVITLDDSLATQLDTRAAAINLSVEEYAQQVLREVACENANGEWRGSNRRRGELIRKQFKDGLTTEEHVELQRLQEMADRRLDQLDDQTLYDVERLRQKVDQIVKESSG